MKKCVDDWVKQEQGKHFCVCGCNQKIIIKRNHKWFGIPKLISGHKTKEQRKEMGLKCRGRKNSEETKRKMSKAAIGRKLSEEHKKKISDSEKGKKMSEESKRKISENSKSPSKENHWNWQGGVSFGEYCYKFNEKCKESNREKFNRKCFLCGKLETTLLKEINKKLSVHHIDYDKEQGCNNKVWDLVPLCNSCHSKVHGKNIGKYYEWLLSTILYYREMILEYNNKIDYRSI